MIISPTEARARVATPQSRRLAAAVIASVVSVALGVCAASAGSTTSGIGSFVLFALSLPWTISIYVLTMVFNVTSPIAVAVTFVLMTLLAWRFVNRLLVRNVL